MTSTPTIDLIEGLSDDELPDALWEHVRSVLDVHGCGDSRSYRAAVLALPRGLRATFTLMLLDSEVQNGGFYQYFTNSSGQFVQETLEDLRLIGANDHADLLEQAIAVNQRIESKHPAYRDRWINPQPHLDATEQEELWSEIRQIFLPEFESLENAFHKLEESSSLWNYFIAYIRSNREKVLHTSCREISLE